MKKVLIITVSCILIVSTASMLLIYELRNQGITGVEDSDLQHLKDLGFKQDSFGYDPEFSSDNFEGLRVGINESFVHGYERYGQRYGDYVVTGAFYFDGTDEQYTFDVFPYKSADDTIDNTYRLTTDHKITNQDKLWTNDQQLINIFNNFIDSVEPLVNYNYQTEFVEFGDYGISEEIESISNSSVIDDGSDYIQIDSQNYDEAYLKDDFLFEKFGDNLWVSYYMLEQNQRVLRYETEEDKEYYLLDENDVVQELNIGNEEQHLDFINEEVLSRAMELIKIMDDEYNQAKTVLI